MSKGLEALEKVEDFEIQFGGYDETGEYKNYISLYQTPEYQVIKKELKVLEIIKEKAVNVLMFKPHFIISKPEYEEYQYYLDNCEKYGFSAFYLTRQEFDLLKEVLL